MKTITKVGQVISYFLTKRGMRVAELARLVGLPQPTLHRIVNGVCVHPHVSSLLPIADFFGITIEQLQGYEPINDGASILKVPLLAWTDLSSWADADTTLVDKVFTDAQVGPNGFAVRVIDDAMDPVFPRHTMLIIDPDKVAKHLSFVVVQLHDHILPIFRQLCVFGDVFYLHPLHPDRNRYKVVKKSDNDKILGLIVQAKRDWGD